MSTPKNEISEQIKARLIEDEIPYNANDSIAKYINEEEREALFEEVQKKAQSLLDSLIIDTSKDPNTQETAKRMAKMFLYEVMAGRYSKEPDLKIFPNTKALDELIVLGPITVRSMCSHHFVPIIGKCWVGVLPGEKLFGISKFSRICNWIMARPQIQEEATVQLADYIQKHLNPMGVIVVVKASHMCMQWRGVKDGSLMTTSTIRGVFAKNPIAKQEFFELIKE